MLENYIIKTPLIPLHTDLQRKVPAIYLKAESLQPLGSYKIRGILRFLKVFQKELIKGLSTVSAGNLGQVVAFIGQQMQIPSHIYVPDSASSAKVNMIKKFGANIIALPYADIWAMVRDGLKNQTDGLFIHPVFSQPLIDGYETIFEEILLDLPDVEAVVVPFATGGLTLGIAQAIQRLKPAVHLYTCEPETAAPLRKSLKLQKPASVKRQSSFVDTIGVPEVLPQVFYRLKPWVKESLVISLAQIKRALCLLFYRHKLICEGAAACSLAAAMHLAKRYPYQRIVCLLTGGNIDLDSLNQLLVEERCL